MSTLRCLCPKRVRDCWNNPSPPRYAVFLSLLVVQAGFGFYPVLVKKFNASANPLIFSLYRDTLAVPVLLLCALVAEKQLKVPKLKELPLFALLGVLGMFSSQLLYILAVYRVGPNISSVFQQLTPIWGSILAVLTCTEKIPPPNKAFTWSKLAGILSAAGGAAEMTLTGQSFAQSDGHYSDWYMLSGFVFLLCNTFSTALYIMLQKKYIFMKNSAWATLPVSVTLWSYLFGAISMGLASIYYCNQSEVFAIPVQAAYPLVYAVIVASSLCYLLTTWANHHLRSTVVTAFWPYQVPVAVVGSYFVTGDELKPLQYIGAVLIVLGLCLVVCSNFKEEKYYKLLEPNSQYSVNSETLEHFDDGNGVKETTGLLNSHSHVIQDDFANQ